MCRGRAHPDQGQGYADFKEKKRVEQLQCEGFIVGKILRKVRVYRVQTVCAHQQQLSRSIVIYEDLSRSMKVYRDLLSELKKRLRSVSVGREFFLSTYEVDFVSCKIPCVAIYGRFYLKLISNQVYCSQGRN